MTEAGGNPHLELKDYDRRWSELCARRALGRYYRSKGLASHWKRGQDPPDWFLELDGVPLAVEVTRAFRRIEVAGCKGSRPSEEQWVFFRDLGREIKTLVASIPDSGSHQVHMQPMMISTEERAQLLQQVKQYVVDNLSYNSAPRVALLYKKSRGECAKISIEKMDSRGSGVGWSFSSYISPITGSSLEHELRAVVTSAITSKTMRLKNIALPKVLVIVEMYFLRDTFWENLQVDPGPFAEIFRASPSGHCKLLSGSDTLGDGFDNAHWKQ